MATEEPLIAGVAGRYASALFDLAAEGKETEVVEKNLATIEALLDESADLSRMVKSPVIPSDEQVKALSAVLSKAGISGLALNFVRLIAQNRRLFALSDMIKAYRSIAAKARGETTAEVESAVELTAEQTAALKETLKASVGRDVTLVTRVNPALLGGLVVKVGSRMIDSSLRAKLAGLKVALKGA